MKLTWYDKIIARSTVITPVTGRGFLDFCQQLFPSPIIDLQEKKQYTQCEDIISQLFLIHSLQLKCRQNKHTGMTTSEQSLHKQQENPILKTTDSFSSMILYTGQQQRLKKRQCYKETLKIQKLSMIFNLSLTLLYIPWFQTSLNEISKYR